MDRLIVALGNPGLEYEYTRHNIAWMVFDNLEVINHSHWKEKFKGLYHSASSAEGKVYFLKPHTFMNLSGESVKALASFFKVSVENILVIQDEIDLPFGTIAFKKGGGLAGHNGLKSIANHMGSQEFLRIRVGIGRPIHGSVSSWVLGRYNNDEEIYLGDYLKKVAESIEEYIEKGFDKAAGKHSKKNILPIGDKK
jgi:PTH1 family peptidyl-tRNA hydrolase